MTYNSENPTTALKAAFLHLLQDGCVASAYEAPFPDGDSDEPWGYLTEDSDTQIVAPSWMVSQAGENAPIAEYSPAGCVVPIKITLFAPHGAEEEWLRACVDEMYRFLTATYHAREIPSPADRTPLAWRLNSAAEEMDPPANLFVHGTTVPQWRAFGYLAEFITAEFELNVVCGLYDA